MRTLTSALCLIIALSTSSQGLTEPLDDVINKGNRLVEAVSSNATVDLRQFENTRDIRRYLSANRCRGLNYEAYLLESGDQQTLYLVGSRSGHVIIGRHFKAPVIGNAVDVESFESSTRTCLDLGPVPENVAALMASHLAPEPNEFHFLQSVIHDVDLFVAAGNGLYKVSEGSIKLSERE